MCTLCHFFCAVNFGVEIDLATRSKINITLSIIHFSVEKMVSYMYIIIVNLQQNNHYLSQ